MIKCLPSLILFLMYSGLPLSAQQFEWGADGYASLSGGGGFENVDGQGTTLTITLSPVCYDITTTQDGTPVLQVGIDNQQPSQIQHEYVFEFSQPVDFQFKINQLNAWETAGSCYNDELTFSGAPLFFNKSNVTIDGQTVIPDGPYPSDGTVGVWYVQTDSFSIIHGSGVSCNPGYIYIWPLIFPSITATTESVQNLDRIYPNPATDQIQIESTFEEIQELYLVHPTGKRYSPRFSQVGGSVQIEVADLPRGFYQIVLRDINQTRMAGKVILH